MLQDTQLMRHQNDSLAMQGLLDAFVEQVTSNMHVYCTQWVIQQAHIWHSVHNARQRDASFLAATDLHTLLAQQSVLSSGQILQVVTKSRVMHCVLKLLGTPVVPEADILGNSSVLNPWLL